MPAALGKAAEIPVFRPACFTAAGSGVRFRAGRRPPRPHVSRSLTERSARASPRSRQQRRSGSASPKEENAARRGVSRNEAQAQLREALGTARPGKGRGGAPLPQALAQAHGARGILRRTTALI